MKSQKFLSLAPIFWALAFNVVISLNAYADDAMNRVDYMDEHNRGNDKHNRGDDEHYVYTNDGQEKNTVTGFKVAHNGSLTKIDQWPTGGTGCPHGFGPATRASISKNGDTLFVSNGFGVGDQITDGTCPSVAATISMFKGASHGKLHLVKLISDPANLTPGDTSVASFGDCLIIGSTNGKKLLSYKPPAIKLVDSLSLEDSIVDMKVTKVGETRYAAATLVNLDTFEFKNQIAVTQINTNTCALAAPTIITTSGEEVAGPGLGSTGLGFSPDGRKMYVADANGDFDTGQTIVEAFEFPSGNPLPGSPYVYPYPAAGNNSETVLASKDGKCLFVGYQFTATVTSIPLRNGVPPVSGSSSVVANQVGDPTVPDIAIGMANDIDRKLLYVGIHPNTDDPLPTNYVTTQLIGKDCTLKEATGGSASTDVSTNDGLLTSIVATGDD